MRGRRLMLSWNLRASRTRMRMWMLVIPVLIAPLGLGCLSHEYEIPKDELWRLAHLPAEARGQRVRVVQNLGERRSPAVDADQTLVLREPAPVAQAPSAPVDVPEADVPVHVSFDARSPEFSPGYPASVGRGVAPPPRASRSVAAPTVRGKPGVGGNGSGGGGFNLGGCCGGGGGGNGADALVVLAVVVVGAAVIGTIALGASEGARFDGHARVAPEQPIHMKDGSGRVSEIPLSLLSREQASAAVEATIMDDEGAGLRRLEGVPTNRVGGAFRLELGTSAFTYGTTALVGPMAHIQAGGFVTQSVGIFLDLGLSGGSDCCGGTIVRHSLAVEVDVLPLKLGPVHAGIFGKVGGTRAGDVGNRLTGTLGGAGVLIEFDLTSRMALTLRGGANTAHLDNGWSPAGTLTAGLAIY